MNTLNLFCESTKSSFRSAVNSYFHPVENFKSIFKNIDVNYPERNNKNYYKHVLSLISHAICYNQGELIQYSYTAADKHKNLKYLFHSGNAKPSDINKLLKELVVYLNSKFFEITATNFNHLQLIYSLRSSSMPRICLKGNFKTEDKDTIVSVFRNNDVSYTSDCEIDKNTGFSRILSTGKYYLNNNIPKSVFDGEYLNPRINQDLVLNQKNKKINLLYNLSNSLNLKLGDVPLWKDFWIDSKTNNDSRSFYKSTLIIPMTLWNNKLSKEFIKNFTSSFVVDRYIFGFLCFDHIETDYFNDDLDVQVGYIFADILSIYLFMRLVYTELSKTINKIEEDLNYDFLNQILDSIEFSLDEIEVKRLNYTNFVDDIKSTSNNSLLSIDPILKKYGSSSFSKVK